MVMDLSNRNFFEGLAVYDGDRVMKVYVDITLLDFVLCKSLLSKGDKPT